MPHKHSRTWRQRIERLAPFGPMAAMAVLALATFWLVRNAPSPEVEEGQRLVTHDPDYLLSRFVVRNYANDGRLTSEIMGSAGRHFPDTDTFEVDNVRIRAVSEDGRLITATAQSGLSNGNATEVSLHGNAVVIQEPHEEVPRLEFRGNELRVWPEEERVRSDQAVELLRGRDRMTGESLHYDKQQASTEIGGRVHTVLQPTTKP